jgi:hypothetical protein
VPVDRNVCTSCKAPAPKVNSAGTLAGQGWRMTLSGDINGRPTKVEWLCPECAQRREGSAPLSKSKAKG